MGYEKKFICILDFWSIRSEELQKRVLLITGNPGIGKTTLLMKAVDTLKDRGYHIGGMISRELREAGKRVGFEILDLNSSRSGWLAHVNQKDGPKIGKYRVNIEDLNRIGAQAISYAVANCAIVAIDEIGPMELCSAKFKHATHKALESRKPILAVVHWKAHDKLICEAKNREDAETFAVTQENRDKLPELLIQRIIKLLFVKS